MEQVILYNPENGADIISDFCPREDEKRDKEDNIINSEHIIFKKDSQLKTNRKSADFILKTWGFIQECGTTEKPVDLSEEKTPEVQSDPEVEKTPEIASDEATDHVEEKKDSLECDKCGKVCKSSLGLMAHKRHCK